MFHFRRIRAVLVCACVAALFAVLTLVAWATFPSRHVPAQEELEVASGRVDRVTERCERSGGPSGYPLTCYWTVVMGGRRLSWPWVDPKGRAEETEAYFRRHGPIKVWLDGETIYQIALEDGSVYLPYANAADAASDRYTLLAIGWVLLGALGLLKVGLELLHGSQRGVHDAKVRRPPNLLGVVCLYGGAMLTLVSLPHTWWAVLAITLLAVGLGLVRQPLHRLLAGTPPRK